jgi:hypothetical protein
MALRDDAFRAYAEAAFRLDSPASLLAEGAWA